MIWHRKKSPESITASTPTPDDIGEARQLRAEAAQEILELQKQEPMVRRLVSSLAYKAARNHFGDSIQITFVRR